MAKTNKVVTDGEMAEVEGAVVEDEEMAEDMGHEDTTAMTVDKIITDEMTMLHGIIIGETTMCPVIIIEERTMPLEAIIAEMTMIVMNFTSKIDLTEMTTKIAHARAVLAKIDKFAHVSMIRETRRIGQIDLSTKAIESTTQLHTFNVISI